MRAIVITRPGPPDVLQVVERPTPQPAAHELLVRVHAAGVNRADLLQRLGRYPAPPGVPADVPGLEYAGVVETADAKVGGWHPGDRVMGLVAGGAYAEFLTTPAEHALPIPRAWSFAQAAAVPEAFLTAFDALTLQGGLAPGQCVLIHAVGSGVGIAALQLAKAAGLTVAGTSRSPWKLERAAEYGLDRPIRVSGAFDPAADLRGWADLILDLVGGPYLAGNLRAVAPRGRILVVGLTGGREGSLDMGALLSKRVTLIGTVLRSRSAEEKTALTQAFRVAVIPAFETGRVRPVVDRAFPVGEAADAHRYVEANKNFGSVVLEL
jgi:putative PIG3 family NAD(P)H quinone oxidoreductase